MMIRNLFLAHHILYDLYQLVSACISYKLGICLVLYCKARPVTDYIFLSPYI